MRVGGAVEDGQIEYAIEEVISKRHNDLLCCYEFEVKWKNFPRSENTWEVYGVISDTEAMGHYEKEHGSQLFVPPDAGRSKHALAARVWVMVIAMWQANQH